MAAEMTIQNKQIVQQQIITWTLNCPETGNTYTRVDTVALNNENAPLGKTKYYVGGQLIADSDPATYFINVAVNKYKLGKQ